VFDRVLGKVQLQDMLSKVLLDNLKLKVKFEEHSF
jgi:hypothetical protein